MSAISCWLQINGLCYSCLRNFLKFLMGVCWVRFVVSYFCDVFGCDFEMNWPNNVVGKLYWIWISLIKHYLIVIKHIVSLIVAQLASWCPARSVILTSQSWSPFLLLVLDYFINRTWLLTTKITLILYLCLSSKVFFTF